MNESLSYVNLSLESHVVSTFWLGSDTSGTILASHCMNLRDQPWRCTYFAAELTFVAANFLQKYPWCYTVHFQFHLFGNWTIYQHLFHQISTKIICKQLIPFRESHDFFEEIPGVLGRSVNFNITEISIKTIRVIRLSFRFSWLCW